MDGDAEIPVFFSLSFLHLAHEPGGGPIKGRWISSLRKEEGRKGEIVVYDVWNLRSGVFCL